MTDMASTAGQGQPGFRPELRWLVVWTRAVLGPAARRADAAWIGCGIVGSVIFGPTAMRPSDLTGLALHDLGVGLVLTAIWLLVFLPTARLIVRPIAAAYLTSLPGHPRTARALSVGALIGLQLPWLALWILGEGVRGGAIVLAITAVIVALARWQPVRYRTRVPRWRGPAQALRAIHRRALRRRAGDALLRAAGLAVLAGMAAGLMVRNNQLSGRPAAVLAASVIALVLVPAQIGPALATLAAYRESAWVAQSFGISPRARVAALAATGAIVHGGAAVLAAVAAMIVAGANPWLAILAIGAGLGTSLFETRTIVVKVASPSVAAHVVVRAIVAAAIAVLCLALLDAAGVLALLALGAFAVLAVAP